MFRQDYLLRLIEQLGAALRRIAGLNRKEDHAAAMAGIDAAWTELLDVPRELIDVVDTPTLAGMLRIPAKMRIAAQLATEEGRARAGRGDPVHAAILYRRAIELYLEARALDPTIEDDHAVLELSRRSSARER